MFSPGDHRKLFAGSLGLLCIGLLITGMGNPPAQTVDNQSNLCGGLPCCWNKSRIQEANRAPRPLTRLKTQSYRGRIILWDPENRWTFTNITEKTCRVSVNRNPEGGYIVESSIFPHSVPLTIQMHPGSEFYLGTFGEKDVFIFQPYRGGGSFTHTTYDKSGEIEYGACGTEKGYMIRACDTVDGLF